MGKRKIVLFRSAFQQKEVSGRQYSAKVYSYPNARKGRRRQAHADAGESRDTPRRYGWSLLCGNAFRQIERLPMYSRSDMTLGQGKQDCIAQ